MAKLKSDVWKFFIRNSDGIEAECKLCNKSVKSAKNTTNLHTHLKTNHPNIKYKAEQSKKMCSNDKDIEFHDDFQLNRKRNSSCLLDSTNVIQSPSKIFRRDEDINICNMESPVRNRQSQCRIDNLLSKQRSYEGEI